MNIIYKVLNRTYALMMIFIIMCCLFGEKINFARKEYTDKYLPAIILIPMGMIFVLGMLSLIKKIDFNSKCLKILLMILLLLQIYSSWSYYFYTDWDPSTLSMCSDSLAHKMDVSWMSGYFSKYPNNLFLVFIFYTIKKCMHIIGLHSIEYFSIIVFQCILVTLTGWILYKSLMQLLKDEKYAFFGYALYTLIIGLSPWVSIPYSDSMGLLFPILIFYLYINRNKNTIFKWIMIGIVSVVGYKIKPQIFIVFIAVCLVEVIGLFKRKMHIKNICALIFGMTISTLSVNIMINSMPISVDKTQKFGIQHFFMMGMNPDAMGVYSEEDVKFSESFSNVYERNREDSLEAINRIKKMREMGILKQTVRKTLTNYYDGTFGWAGEGEFFAEILNKKDIPGENFFRKIYYTRNYSKIGIYYILWSNFEQMLWMTIISLDFWAIFYQKKTYPFYVIMLGIIGLTIFELLFEARARYLYTFIPLYIILAILGIDFLSQEKITKIKRKKEKHDSSIVHNNSML